MPRVSWRQLGLTLALEGLLIASVAVGATTPEVSPQPAPATTTAEPGATVTVEIAVPKIQQATHTLLPSLDPDVRCFTLTVSEWDTKFTCVPVAPPADPAPVQTTTPVSTTTPVTK